MRLQIKKANLSPSLGFSAVELVVVVGIIGILFAILLIAVNSVRSRFRTTACQNRMTQIAKASLNFESAKMHLPTGAWHPEILDFLHGGTDAVSVRDMVIVK